MIPSAVCVIALLAGSACPPRKPPDAPGLVKPHQLPDAVTKLLAYANQRIALGTANGFHYLYHADALVALSKARKRAPSDRQVLLLGSRVCRTLAERARGKGEQLKYADLGLVFTEAGRQHFGAEVAFHHLHAALLGLRVDAYHASAFSVVPKIKQACEQAISIDRLHDHAGPLRVLGSLLASIPESSPFNGDLERGIKLLTLAVKLAPSYPLNHYFLAEALAKDEERDRAAKHYAQVICASTGPDYDAILAHRYRALAKRGLRTLKRSDATDCKGSPARRLEAPKTPRRTSVEPGGRTP
ncbi:MAG: hypothetical protein ABI333_08075 [bacterium]